MPSTSSEHKEPQSISHSTFLGMPRFEWSLTLIGLCMYTFVIVSYKVNVAVIGIGIGALGLMFGRDGLRIPFPVWMYTAYMVWVFLGSFASPYPEVAIEQLIERCKLIPVMLIAANALRTREQFQFFQLFFIATYILFPVRGALVNYFIAGHNLFGRALWNYIYGNPNDLAALSLLALGIALSVMTTVSNRTMAKRCVGISIVMIMLVILLTQSRGAVLGSSVLMAPYLFYTLKKSPRQAIMIVVVFIVIAVSVPGGVWKRLAGIKQLTDQSTIHLADPEGSAAQRFNILKVAWNIISDHPIFGVGLGAYPMVNAAYAPELGKKDTHNTYLNLAAEVGIPGLLIWCWFVGSVLRFSFPRSRPGDGGIQHGQQRWMWWGFAGYLVAGIFGTFSKLSFPYLMLAMLWCSQDMLARGRDLTDDHPK